MSCAFCDIMKGEQAAHIVYEDEVSVAFRDKRPLFPGHCLIVPKKHIGTLVELDVVLIGWLSLQVKKQLKHGCPAKAGCRIRLELTLPPKIGDIQPNN